MQFVLLLFALLSSQFDDVQVTSLDGSRSNGKLQQLNRQLARVGDANYPTDQIANIRLADSVSDREHAGAECILVDESILVLQSWEIKDQSVSLTTVGGATFETSTRNILAIKPRRVPDEFIESWEKLTRAPLSDGDAIIIRRDGVMDSLEGRIGNTVDDKLTFSIDDQTANVRLSRIDGLVFYHAAGRKLDSPFTQLQLTDGSRLNLQDVQYNGGEQIRGETVAGVSFEIELPKVYQLDFQLGRTVYLSDLKPLSLEWEALISNDSIAAYLRQLNLPRTNRSFRDKPLSLVTYDPDSTIGRRVEFENGFAIKSGSKIAFRLNGQYKTLAGLVGFDPDTHLNGNLKLIVRGDGKELLGAVMENSRTARPIQLNLPVANVSRLVIEVDYHDGRSVGDILHFCNLRAQK